MHEFLHGRAPLHRTFHPHLCHCIFTPPYSPELNPTERLWDVVKDQICNSIFKTLDPIEEKITEALRPFWEQPTSARKLGAMADFILKQTIRLRT